MKNGQNHGSNFKKESHSSNQFNDSEYKRWSKGITATQSNTTQSGIESFLGTNETPQSESEETSGSLTAIGEQ
jgi:hypothetical protein